MKKRDNIKIAILTLFVALLANSCATAPVAKDMIPSFNYTVFVSSDKTLKVAEVKGGEKTNPMSASKIENEGFQEALIKGLEQSGMFKQIVTDKNGDYALHTEIISQTLLQGTTMTTVLFVNYRLVETKSNQEVWKDNILSQYDAKFEAASYGVERAKKANEGAVRNNLSQLIKKLSDILSKLNKK